MRYTIRTIVVWLTLLGFPLTHWGQTGALQEYLQQAAENNPGVKSAYYQYEAALRKVPQVKTLPDPEVSFSYFIRPIETRWGPQRAKVGGRQMFPWLGTLQAKGKEATLRARAKYEKFVDKRNRLFLQVKQKWYELYEIERTIELVKENLNLVNQLEQIAGTKFETGRDEGKSGMVDVLRVQMERETLENRLAKMKDKKQAKTAAFNALLNRSQRDTVRVTDSLSTQSLPADTGVLLDTLVARNPDLSQLDYQQQAWQQNKKVARKSGMPRFGIGMDYIFVGEPTVPAMGDIPAGQDALMLPMFTMQVPLYRQKYRGQIEEAEFHRKALVEQTEDIQNKLRSRFEKYYQQYTTATREIELYQRQVQKAQQALDVLSSNYGRDASEFEEVLRMERQLLDYRLQLEKAHAQQRIAIAHINYLTGQTLDQ